MNSDNFCDGNAFGNLLGKSWGKIWGILSDNPSLQAFGLSTVTAEGTIKRSSALFDN